MSWFRLYTSILNDPKIQLLPKELAWGWVNILCIAKDNSGVLPNITAIAFALRITGEEACNLIETLIKNGLIDKTKNGLTPHNWTGRQYISDASTDRVKRFRERKRNVSETPPETETETETETPIPPKGVLSGFESFWKAYPKKQSRGQAEKAWRQLSPNEQLVEEILQAIERAKKSDEWRKDGGAFIQYPATWLRAKGWLNEYPQTIIDARTGIEKPNPVYASPSFQRPAILDEPELTEEEKAESEIAKKSAIAELSKKWGWNMKSESTA